jgi:hypothetical protein
MIDASYPPHRMQEHRSSTYRSAGTSECVIASRVLAWRTTRGITRRGTFWDRAGGSWEPNGSGLTGWGATATGGPWHGRQDWQREPSPRAILKPRRCTEMLMRWSPSGLNLWSSLADFGLCWSTWASPPLPGTGSKKSRIQGGWSSRPSQRFSSDPESSADTMDQLSGPLVAMLLLMPLGRTSHHGSVVTRASCRTRSTTSYPTGRRINSRPTEWNEESYSRIHGSMWGIFNGCKSPAGLWHSTLTLWQLSHRATYLDIALFIPYHQYLFLRSWYILVLPGWME